MTFDPKKMADISDSMVEKLTRELGAETKRDAHNHIAKLAKQAKDGDDQALVRLAMSCAASLAVTILNTTNRLLNTDDTRGDELRLMLAALPELDVVIIMAALRAATFAYLDMEASQGELHTASDISDMIWEDVRDMAVAARDGAPVGRRKSKKGADIFVVPANGKPH